jgi:hypothetical protein
MPLAFASEPKKKKILKVSVKKIKARKKTMKLTLKPSQAASALIALTFLTFGYLLIA